MKIEILSSAMADLAEGRQFYEEQSEGLGEYFFDSLFSDIDSLTLYAGIHKLFYGVTTGCFQKDSHMRCSTTERKIRGHCCMAGTRFKTGSTENQRVFTKFLMYRMTEVYQQH